MDLGVLGQNLTPFARSSVEQSLVQPALQFLRRESKQVRYQLVLSGYFWNGSQVHEVRVSERCQQIGEILELLHSASLIIDDIQDDSASRRGLPCVHRQIGVPKAINLGNWLYFAAFQKLHEMGLAQNQVARMSQLFSQALCNGHAGQALDLGIRIADCPPARISEVCHSSMRLKTGALTGLAMASGAVLADLSTPIQDEAYRYGVEIGLVLQSYDDLKNLKLDPLTPEKRFEDLKSMRPSLIWQWAAEHSNPKCLSDLKQAADLLPEEDKIFQWLTDYEAELHLGRDCKQRVADLLGVARERWQSERNESYLRLKVILQKLVDSYEKL
ncbi:MAG: polyprenyl synthetase family protein [Bdellovibrionales bacterium]